MMRMRSSVEQDEIIHQLAYFVRATLKDKEIRGFFWGDEDCPCDVCKAPHDLLKLAEREIERIDAVKAKVDKYIHVNDLTLEEQEATKGWGHKKWVKKEEKKDED